VAGSFWMRRYLLTMAKERGSPVLAVGG